MNGTMVRTMSFQSWFNMSGMTGWMLPVYFMAFAGPMPKSQLFWIGTLIRLATGFWVCLANSTELSGASAAVLSSAGGSGALSRVCVWAVAVAKPPARASRRNEVFMVSCRF